MSSQAFAVAERPAATECRIYERLSCELPTTCQPASALAMKEMRWTATISDISLGGVRILLPRRFEKGTGLAVELPGTDDRESTVVFVKVVHVKANGDGTWALGCRFLSELSEDQLQSLLNSTRHVLASSKQESVEEDAQEAVPAAAEPHFLSNVHLAVETGPAAKLNLVIRRLNVTKCWPLTPGKMLNLNGKLPNKTPWTLRVYVAKCNQTGKGWEIAGSIVGSADGLRALGRA